MILAAIIRKDLEYRDLGRGEELSLDTQRMSAKIKLDSSKELLTWFS
jgi:hypothetical protein